MPIHPDDMDPRDLRIQEMEHELKEARGAAYVYQAERDEARARVAELERAYKAADEDATGWRKHGLAMEAERDRLAQELDRNQNTVFILLDDRDSLRAALELIRDASTDEVARYHARAALEGKKTK